MIGVAGELALKQAMQSIMIGVAGEFALKQADIVCAINNDRSSRVVSLEASKYCLCNQYDRSSRVVSLEASRHCL